jgi:small-conductance mechanosensitive channel
VIPNGDLLNQHLVNWTRENTSRAIDIPVNVAHGTDLERAITILKELPAKDDRILFTPAPGVAITQFNNGSIDMHLSFWVKNLSESVAVKSDMLLAIDRAFKENSIQIPLPLQFTPTSAALADGGKK